ncbi:MAG: SEL1-like repeat protein [Acidobacteriaceae bacterium]|nr:SEL1-like repeat protein [Acidobacteriaceae bacterium]MBV9781184.1 SEL1-like repeat protein [Acidobacteriaceae bacterium]
MQSFEPHNIPQAYATQRYSLTKVLGIVAAISSVTSIANRVNAQEPDLAAKIYRSASPAVFVVSVRNESGALISLGTGFLIAKNTVVTNLHVASGGVVFVEAGGVRVRADVTRRDAHNDLAILKITAGLEAQSLALSTEEPLSGQSIFVIGNPEGLEKTISTGVISGRRNLNGRDLLQITAPISHGSSGGPVLNSSGQIVGITVAMLSEGQNLNFAVPADRIRSLLGWGRPDVQTDAEDEKFSSSMHSSGHPADPPDPATKAAFTKILEAANRGVPAAQALIGSFIEMSDSPNAPAAAEHWYRLAANQGDPAGQLGLGKLYEKGKALPQDYAEAVYWYKKAADQGYAPAQTSLGVLLYQGHGVERNPALALTWWRKAADQGDADAQVRVGAFYETGEVVPQDFPKAAEWFEKSAERGNVAAQEMLGMYYAFGRGVPKNDIRAYMWLNLAVANSTNCSDEERQRRTKMRNEVAGSMTSEQLVEAQRLASEWRPSK